jgi:phosphatidylserine decarboxylase
VSTYPHPIIAREGWPFLAIALVVAIAVTWLGWWIVAAIAWLLFVFILQFFRDPPRQCPRIPGRSSRPRTGASCASSACATPTSGVTRW